MLNVRKVIKDVVSHQPLFLMRSRLRQHPTLQVTVIQAHYDLCAQHPSSYKTWVSRENNNSLDLRMVAPEASFKHRLWQLGKEQRKQCQISHSQSDCSVVLIPPSY